MLKLEGQNQIKYFKISTLYCLQETQNLIPQKKVKGEIKRKEM